MLVGHLAASRPGPVQGRRTYPASSDGGTAAVSESEKSFRTLLEEARLKFSHHAAQRLEQRGIRFQPEQLDRIASAIDQAEAKGAKDSLVLYRDVAMIVNVPNRTVVTALDGTSMREHVFTQIDSAVVVG
ncbi:flagellar biosynthesis protein [Cohnella fermenti]|uniref:Flagellar biosynthesis protein n=2 Tax=Cohnella fermenti TaxID=2565925 RepID=A0A4S4C139_9BACL|nr:flagellar biosynthesis protein [Cohnella fermenti]